MRFIFSVVTFVILSYTVTNETVFASQDQYDLKPMDLGATHDSSLGSSPKLPSPDFSFLSDASNENMSPNSPISPFSPVIKVQSPSPFSKLLRAVSPELKKKKKTKESNKRKLDLGDLVLAADELEDLESLLLDRSTEDGLSLDELLSESSIASTEEDSEKAGNQLNDQADKEIAKICSLLKRGNRGPLKVKNKDKIVSDKLANFIMSALGFEGTLPKDYQDVRLLFNDKIRLVVLDTEWDRKRDVTEIAAIEYLNGKRGHIKFSKYNNKHPAYRNIEEVLNYIKADYMPGFVTLVAAHNAPADYSILLYEMWKNFERCAGDNDGRILEHKKYATYWFDSYMFLKRDWQIPRGLAEEQAKIRKVNFSYPDAYKKREKSEKASEKYQEAKKRKVEDFARLEKLVECFLIELSDDMEDSSCSSFDEFISDYITEDHIGMLMRFLKEQKESTSKRNTQNIIKVLDRLNINAVALERFMKKISDESGKPEADKFVSSPMPSFKLQSVFESKGGDMEKFTKRQKMSKKMLEEKNIAAGEHEAHYATYDVNMETFILMEEVEKVKRKKSYGVAKKLKFKE